MTTRRHRQQLLLLMTILGVTAISASFRDYAGWTCCAVGACVASTTLKIVTTGDECLVERFGRFHRRLGPGWHLVAPLIETVSFHDTLREQVLDVPPQQCYTRDNAPIKADAVVYMRIVDMEAARYNVMGLQNAILNLCLTQLREQVGKLTLDESFSSRDRLNKALLEDLNNVCLTWGVEITRVEIQNLEPSRDILVAMELQMAAEREKRAAILHSEGERIKLINEAEGRAGAVLANANAQRSSILLAAEAESDRLRLEAEGMRNSIEIISKLLTGQDTKMGKDNVNAAMQMLMFVRYMETQAKFAGGNGTKVLMFPSKDSLPLTYEGLQGLLK